MFKFNLKKSNLASMIVLFIMLIFNSVVWLILKNYICFYIFSILTVILLHMYLTTKYEIGKENLILYFGFIKIKIKYNNIKDIICDNNKVSIKVKNVKIDLYPEDSNKFVNELKKKLGDK